MRSIFIILSFVLSIAASAQNVDYNKIIYPSSAADLEFEEKLVRLAWQNLPVSEILLLEQNISEIELKQARWDWLENFTMSGNINEFNINQPDGGTNQFFPRYNFRATFSLGDFVNLPLEAKSRKEKLMIADQQIKQQKLQIRAEVLRRYQRYLERRELLKIAIESSEEADANFVLIEDNFKRGEATLPDYNAALRSKNDSDRREISADSELKIAKIDLEELIGVKLEDVQ